MYVTVKKESAEKIRKQLENKLAVKYLTDSEIVYLSQKLGEVLNSLYIKKAS